MLRMRDVGRLFLGLFLLSSPASYSEGAAVSCLAGERIRFIIPHPVGGGYDTFYRMLAPFLARQLDADITLENVDGSGGVEGAVMIRDAKPDGRIIGSLNGGGLLCSSLSGDTLAPHPVRDFTILARAARSQHVWLVNANSEWKTLEDVMAAAQNKPVVFGLRDISSTSFVSITLGTHLLDLPHELVTGYKGSREAVLAALRGEIQLVSYNFDSVEDQVRNGELRPILQISDKPISDSPLLKDVPLLGGHEGWAVRRSRTREGDSDEAGKKAASLSELIGAGRLIAGPRGLDPALRECLENAVFNALNDAEFLETAGKAAFDVEPARGEDARRDIENASQQWDDFMPMIHAAIEKVRK